MRAVVHDRYGPPDLLRLEERPVPDPGPDQVLIEVVATSLNLSDWETLVGSPIYARIGGLRAPKRSILGSDIAGRVAAVGADVTSFAEGDPVYGDNLWHKGGFAEYAVAPASALAHKPEGLTFAEASALPQAGAIALQGTAGAGPGVRVAVNGAGGGSGAFAVQLAKRAGAHVTAIDNAGKADFLRSLGADEVVDYRTTDFTRPATPYDLVLDLVAHRSVWAYRRSLAPGGRYRWVGGSVPTLLAVLTAGTIIGLATGRRIGVLAVDQGARSLPAAGRALPGRRDRHPHRPHLPAGADGGRPAPGR